MKLYICLAMVLAAFAGQAQNSTQQGATAKPISNANQGYLISNNGETITITDKATGKASAYPANDTLHYAVLRKIEAEREAAKKQAPAQEPKRENIVR